MHVIVCDLPLTVSGSSWTCPGNLASYALPVPVAFDVNQLDPVVIVEAFGSGFIIAGIPFLTVFCARILISQLKR